MIGLKEKKSFETSRTRVVNIRQEAYDVYIGRTGRGMDGYFGNPFRLSTGMPRGATLQKYREYFYRRIQTDPEFKQRVDALRGKTLGCFCKPNPCHGDIIKEYLDSTRIDRRIFYKKNDVVCYLKHYLKQNSNIKSV